MRMEQNSKAPRKGTKKVTSCLFRQQINMETTDGPQRTESTALASPKTTVLSADLQDLDETDKAMMEISENMIPMGKRQQRAKICKVCGKGCRHNEAHRSLSFGGSGHSLQSLRQDMT